MTDAAKFDQFYYATRDHIIRLVQSCVAETHEAKAVVEGAYREAWARRRRLKRLSEDTKAAWVRDRALSGAYETTRTSPPWQHLDSDEFRAGVLALVAGLTPDQLAAALDRSPRYCRLTASRATKKLAAGLGIAESDVSDHLANNAAQDPLRLPRASVVRRKAPLPRSSTTTTAGSAEEAPASSGRGWWLIAACVATVVVVGVAVWLLRPDPTTNAPASAPTSAKEKLVSNEMLLPASALATVPPKQTWLVSTGTAETTARLSPCQASHFADASGRVFVRTFTAGPAKPTGRGLKRTVTQWVEASSNTATTKKAYQTTLDWYSQCDTANAQLIVSYDISGLGDESKAVVMRLPGAAKPTQTVVITRSGRVTLTTMFKSENGPATSATTAAPVQAKALTALCESNETGSCAARPALRPALPPPAPNNPGMLSTTDLPLIGVRGRWVGTPPQEARVNPASTVCDGTSFAKASESQTRTFVAPDAKLPPRFGVTETYGKFPSVAEAQRFLGNTAKRVNGCEGRNKAAKVRNILDVPNGFRGSQATAWNISTQINANKTRVTYWTGMVRVGTYVAQVTFAPAAGVDMSEAQFQALTLRTRDRLFALADPAPKDGP